MGKKNQLKYKGYTGLVNYDVESSLLFGKIEFIKDLVTFQSDNMESIRKEFEDAVDDYIETCKEVGKEPQKSLSGSFNVRLGPELHEAVALEAVGCDISINEVVKRAVTSYFGKSKTEHHLHIHQVCTQEVHREVLNIGEIMDLTELTIADTKIQKH